MQIGDTKCKTPQKTKQPKSLWSPAKVFAQGLLHVGHVKAGGADGHCWEGHLGHGEGGLLQSGHDLGETIIVTLTIIGLISSPLAHRMHISLFLGC